MWHSSISSQVEELKEVERQLVDFAMSRFDQRSSSNVEIEPFDTKIPRSVVPLKRHECKVHVEDDDSYRIHGLRIHNLETASTRDGPPLVMVHGYMNGASYFYRNLMGLSRHFGTIYSLDLLGWGLSSRPSFDLIDDQLKTAEDFFVESLEAWRRKNDVEKMILAGHSMGGYIGVAYCERYPEHVERLILISPAGVTPETEDTIEKRRMRERLSLGLKFLGILYTSLFFPYMSLGNIIRTAPSWSELKFLEYVERRLPAITDPEERRVVAKYLFLNSSLPGSGEHCLSRFLTPYAFGRSPTEFRVPRLKIQHVSFLYGERDWMDVNGALRVQARCEEKSATGRPSASVFQVCEAGHLLMLDNWRGFNNAMVLAAGLPLQDSTGPIPRKLSPERPPDALVNELDTIGFRPVQGQAMAA